jgi:hypothetical protein
VFYPDVIGSGQIGRCPGDFKDAVIGPGRQLEALHGRGEQQLAGFVQTAHLLDQFAGHLRIEINARVLPEAGFLPLAGCHHPPGDVCTAFAGWSIIVQFVDAHRGHFHMQINAVQQGAGKSY